jgi:hypothetical protein
MQSDVQIRLLRAVHACMRPIARILLRSGITYRQFADIAKLAFVQEAFSEPERTGSKTNVSRVAVQTGMSRKDVARVEATLGGAKGEKSGNSTDHSGPPSRVLHEWHTNPRFMDKAGHPAELPIEGDEPSFSSLVMHVTADVPPAAIRAELLRSGAVEVTQRETIRPLKRFYVPADVDERALTVISQMLFPLASGLAHNSDPYRKADGFIQRVVVASDLVEEEVPVFRRMTRRRAAEFVESVDDWLKNGRTRSKASGAKAGTVGLGVFYYEGPSVDEMLGSPTIDLESALKEQESTQKSHKKKGPN